MANTVEIILEGVDNASGVLTNVGGAMASVAAIAGGALAAGLALSVKEALDAQKTQASLAQVLKSTGYQAGLTQEKANELAQQFKDLAGGSDDAILALETIGLRAGTIAANEMPAFIQTSLDLGAVLGDNAAAAELLARAQEDPLAAMSRLNKAGIVFSASLKEQIKQLVKDGDAAGATALLLERVGEATGGAAQSNADTLSGKWEILQGRMLDAAEGIGTALLPVLTELFDNVIAPALPIIEEAAEKIGTLIETIVGAANAGTLGDLIPPDVMERIQPLLDAFQNLSSAVQEQLPAMQASGQAFVDWLQGAFGILGPQIIANLTTAVNAMAEIWREHGDEITEAVRIAFEIVIATVGGAFTILSGVITAGLQLLNGDWSGAWQTMQDTFTAFMNMVLSIVGTDLPAFVAQWRTNWELLQIIIGKVLMDMTASIQTWIINTINTLKSYYEMFKEIGSGLMDNILIGIQMKVAQIIATVSGMVVSALGAAGKALGETNPFAGGIPQLAAGGIVTSPTLAVIGEAGPEAVVPLSQMGGFGGGSQTIVVQLNGETLLNATLKEGQAQGLTVLQAA